MERLTAVGRARIWGTKNRWSLAPFPEAGSANRECEVKLEIQGTPKNGYNLVMYPAGFFAADHWYKTKPEALDDAREQFGVSVNEWKAISWQDTFP